MGCFSCFGEDNRDLKREERRREVESRRDERRREAESRREERRREDDKESNKSSVRGSDETDSEREERPISRNGSTNSKDAIKVQGGGPIDIASKAFTLSDLADATDNFREENLLGEGGFGRVYKGYLASIDQVVAVKQLDRGGVQGNREFLVEVLMLSLLHHPNLVSLIGYCADGDQRLLVYEYMPLGSLEDHLHDIPPDREPLDWNTRIKIVAGAAKGVEYLHEKVEPPVIYRDMKSSNILLGEGYFPKISDFGLAKLGPEGGKTHVSTRVMGTYGYCAPEYAMTGKLTPKSDVFSFGVVLLEILTGRRAIDYSRPSGEQNLVAWARPLFKDRKNFPKMADPLLHGRFPVRGLYQALAIAAMCVLENASARPNMRDVVTSLSFLASQKYDPNAASSENTPNQSMRGHQKNLSVDSYNRDAATHNHRHEPDVYDNGSETKLNKDENGESDFGDYSERRPVSN